VSALGFQQAVTVLTRVSPPLPETAYDEFELDDPEAIRYTAVSHPEGKLADARASSLDRDLQPPARQVRT